MRPAWRLHNAPRLLLALLAAGSLALPFLVHAPNRLLSGVPVAAQQAGALRVMILLLASSAFGDRRRASDSAALFAGCWGLLIILVGAGEDAAALAAGAAPAARTMLGAGFWGLCFCFCLAAVDALQCLRARPAVMLLMAALLPASVAVLALTGHLSALSIAQEAATHRAAFALALQRHVLLVCATVGLAVAFGVPLGLAAQRRRAWRRPTFFALNIVQTVPSVALFGLLIAPLAAAGFSGIGLVPALIALVLYALLPVVRGVVAGLDGVDAATREAAAGMGMSAAQILWRVDLPLAAPALIAALRIVVVQTIGLAVVAALIGAGGLGDFVFQGLGQYAVDLVLLGALPAIFIALAADLLLRLATLELRTRLA